MGFSTFPALASFSGVHRRFERLGDWRGAAVVDDYAHHPTEVEATLALFRTYHEGPADHPDVIVKTPAEVWLAISKGELDGQQAFMSGRYQVEGDVSLLMKLRSLFSG